MRLVDGAAVSCEAGEACAALASRQLPTAAKAVFSVLACEGTVAPLEAVTAYVEAVGTVCVGA